MKGLSLGQADGQTKQLVYVTGGVERTRMSVSYMMYNFIGYQMP